MAGPAIGFTLGQTHRILFTNVWNLRSKKARNDLKEATQQYYCVRLKASKSEIDYLELQESEYDFNMSTALGLGLVIALHLYLSETVDLASAVVLSALVILLIGAFYAYHDYYYVFVDLVRKYCLTQTQQPAAKQPD